MFQHKCLVLMLYVYSSFFFSGTLGGHMGLFLGASIISLSEIIEMLIIVTARMLSKLRHCRPMDSRVTSQ